MNKATAWITVTALLLGGAILGCDFKPSPPRAVNLSVPGKLAAIPGNQEELTAATQAETARVNYEYRLTVLHDYYLRTGDMDKTRWTENELDNLRRAQTFTWEGVPQVASPKGETLAGQDEHVLVEYAVSARNAYLNAVKDVLAYYNRSAPGSYKAQRVANVLNRFDPVRTYMYFLDAEIPGADLRPVEVIPAADQLYQQASRLHEEGKGFLRTFVTTYYRKERQALMLLLELIRKYPHSTKISLAAFHIAEIYKEYFNENLRAVHWYERAWQWDPAIPKPARFQAAVIHDFRLFNRAKALECYRQAVQHEQMFSDNIRYCHQRIGELTGS